MPTQFNLEGSCPFDDNGRPVDPEIILTTKGVGGSTGEGNDVLAIFDLDAQRAIAHLRMARGADVVMFDPGLGRIYIACSSGAISVFQMDDPAHFRKLEDVAAEPKIHSLAVDLRTHRVYAPAEEEKGRPASKMFVFEAVPNQ